jgi:hypothetical protein
MAVEIPGRTMTFEKLVSDVDMSAKVGYTAKRGTGWALGTDNDATGIIIDGGAASGDYVTVGMGEVMALANATIAVGALVSGDGSALIIQAAGGDVPIGRALSAGTAGKWVRIFVYGYVDESV